MRKLETVSTILLAVGFLATAVGAFLFANTPSSDGFPFGAAFLIFGGITFGALGLLGLATRLAFSRNH